MGDFLLFLISPIAGIANLFNGNTTKNINSQSFTSMLNILNNTIQTCQSQLDVNNNISINADNGSTVTYTSDSNQTYITDTSCVSTSVNRNNVGYNITQQAKLITKSIQAQFSLNSSQTESLYKAMIDLATQITDNFNQNCVFQLTVDNTVGIDADNGSNVTVVNNSTQTFTNINNCIANSNNVTKSLTKVDQLLKSYTKGKTTSFLFYLVMLVIGIGAIGAIVFLLLILFGVIGKKKATGTRKKTTTKKKRTNTQNVKQGIDIAKKVVQYI